MKYDEFQDLCRKSWEEDYNNLCIERSTKRDQGRYCTSNESKKNVYRSNTSDEGFLIIIQNCICTIITIILLINYNYKHIKIFIQV